MARQARGLPSADALAAIALHGSERAAARALGMSRSTLHDAARGLTGVSRALTNALGGLAPAERARVQLTSQSLQAGRTGAEMAARAKELARAERRSPGATERETAAHAERMRQQGLTITGEPLPPDERKRLILERLQGQPRVGTPKHDDQGVAPGSGTLEQRVNENAPPGSWEDLQALWEDHDLDAGFYDAAIAVMTGSGSGGTGVPIAGLLD